MLIVGMVEEETEEEDGEFEDVASNKKDVAEEMRRKRGSREKRTWGRES